MAKINNMYSLLKGLSMQEDNWSWSKTGLFLAGLASGLLASFLLH